jgi:hypothetical protein
MLPGDLLDRVKVDAANRRADQEVQARGIERACSRVFRSRKSGAGQRSADVFASVSIAAINTR